MARSPAACGAISNSSKRPQMTNQEKETDGADPMGSGEPLVTRVTSGGLGGEVGRPQSQKGLGHVARTPPASLRAELCPSERQADILAQVPVTDFVWKQGLCRCSQVQRRSHFAGWALISD